MAVADEKMKEGNCMIEIEKPQIECIEDSANSSYGKSPAIPIIIEGILRLLGVQLNDEVLLNRNVDLLGGREDE